MAVDDEDAHHYNATLAFRRCLHVSFPEGHWLDLVSSRTPIASVENTAYGVCVALLVLLYVGISGGASNISFLERSCSCCVVGDNPGSRASSCRYLAVYIFASEGSGVGVGVGVAALLLLCCCCCWCWT